MRIVSVLGLVLVLQGVSQAFVPPRYCLTAAKRADNAQRHYDASCNRLHGCSAGALRHYKKIATRIAERCVAMNQIQVLGTHNSYHREPRPSLMQALLDFTSAFQAIQYTHVPLPQQFDDQGIRQIELDVYADPNGGLFSVRHGLILVGEDPNSGLPQLDQPGFKIVHLPDIDFDSTCVTFVECLQVIKTWSDAHPTHLPIGIQIEAKTDQIPDIFNVGFITPFPIGSADYDVLDAEIRSVFPPEQMITPDDIRGPYPTLEQGVLARGWPSLAESRGKVFFLHDNGGGDRLAYQRGHQSLEGLILFTNSNPGSPDAAFVKRNDPEGAGNQADIHHLVSQGYLVRTRADGDTVQSRTGNTAQREAAFASGAQFVSTDYPVPDPRFTAYSVAIPDGPVRCNPINAPTACRSIGIQP